jgi:choline dehydrogenase-like flavoprotein
MNLNLDAKKEMTYDAIVVGSGISGGWAAKELTQKGLKVLMLERGPDLKHIADYPTAMMNPWEFPHRGKIELWAAEEYWANARSGGKPGEDQRHMFTKDVDVPYIEKRPYDWIRAYHLGGRSLVWGRQSYRLNERDFTANLEDGHGVDWPIRYKDLAPWYSYVERFAGVSGNRDGLAVLPDGEFVPPMQMNSAELVAKAGIEKNFKGRHLVIGRPAIISVAQKIHTDLGRASCQFRNLCVRGCPYGAYFSTQSATLPAAMKTGRLTVITDKIAYQVIYDEQKGKATGVRVIDQNTKQTQEYYGKIIFLNASSMNTAWIMMQSTSKRFPNGLGNDSDQLGRNLMDHHLNSGASGEYEGLQDMYYYGRRGNGIYIPRFANWGDDKRKDFVRGFGYQGRGGRQDWAAGASKEGFGPAFKDNLTKPGRWEFNIGGFGETLPDPNNRMRLSDKKDKWGLPIIEFDAAWGDNTIGMRKAMMNDAAEMLEAAGFKNIKTRNDTTKNPGIGIHEMGSARMGRDPKTSVLNGNNQVWGAKNVFVTDGAAMVSSSCVNPSLTYMALTARASAFAVSELKRMNL